MGDNQPECGLLWWGPVRRPAGQLGPGLQSVRPPAALPARQDHPHRPPPSLTRQAGRGGRLPRSDRAGRGRDWSWLFAGVWADNKDFDSVLISKRMLQDHMPDNVLDALCQVIISNRLLTQCWFSWSYNQQPTTQPSPPPVTSSNIPTKTNKLDRNWTAPSKGVSCCQASQVHAWQSAVSTVNIARNNKYKVCLLLSPPHQRRELTGSGLNIILHVVPLWLLSSILYPHVNEACPKLLISCIIVSYIFNFTSKLVAERGRDTEHS